MNKKAIIIDGNSLMYRAYYATINQLEYYLNNNLKPANALKLMIQFLRNIRNEYKSDYAVIAYDHKDKSFRKEQYDWYKSKRKATPKELIEQIEIIQDASKYLGFNVLCVSGIEADDVIGSIVNKFENNGIESMIFSSDKDLLQLVSEKTKMCFFKTGISKTLIYDINNFKEMNDGLLPKQIVDYKSLAGDQSDNIPGSKGIGKKTAINLILEFDNIKNLYNNFSLIKNNSIRTKLENSKELVYISYELSSIRRNELSDINIEDLLIKEIDIKEINKIIKDYNFNSLKKYFN